MKTRALLYLVFIMSAYFLGACSGVKFSETFDCEKDGSCVVQNGKPIYPAETHIVEGGKVDILIVDDNSASMSTEQKQLAARFDMFIQNLDTKSIDYRIGFTTTDISTSQNEARAINQNGALQDGKLIALKNGKKYISKDDGNTAAKVALFNNAIQRQETIDCEAFITNWVKSGKTINETSYTAEYKANCPSGDERGIYSAYLTIKNNYDSFIRPEADLHIIFLSDEDVRSQMYLYSSSSKLDVLDTGKNLVQFIRSSFASKTFGIHTIIIADEYCKPIQSNQMSGIVKGTYGTEYNNARLEAKNLVNSERSAKGLAPINMVLGDICTSDYTGLLSNIFDSVSAPIVDSFSIKCANPEGLDVKFDSSDTTIKFEVQGDVIKFNKKLPMGSKVYISSYSCPQ